MDISLSSTNPPDVQYHSTSGGKCYILNTNYSNMRKIQFNFLTIHQLIKTLNQEVHDKLRHPQWKHFKHMEVCDSDRVRISNIIWRSWHIKFQHNSFHLIRSSQFLDFTIPDLDTTHKHSESVVLEGQYWCRKNVRVALEYSNWRQEFRKNKRYNGLSNQSSGIHTYQPALESKSNLNCLFSYDSNDSDFPIFTQNEIDDLVMLDMHDTLFTSNHLNLYPPGHSSEHDYLPLNCGIPSHLGYYNIQPALDHLHPFYQGFFDTFSTKDVVSDRIHSDVYSRFYSNLPSDNDIPHLHAIPQDLPPNYNMQSFGEEKRFLSTSDRTPQKFDASLKTSKNRGQWDTDVLSLEYRPYDEITESYQPHMLTKSPKGLLSGCDTLDLCYENPANSNIQSSTKEPQLIQLIHSMQGRILHLERQISLHQGLFDNLSKTNQKLLSMVDPVSSISSPKRFRRNSDGNSPNSLEESHTLGALDSHIHIPCPSPSSITSTSIIPKYTSDHKRRYGIKSLLEQLESKVPKQNLNGAKLSNASLLLRAGDFARDLQNQIHVIERELSELQSKMSIKRKSIFSEDLRPIFNTSPEISEKSDRFEEYLKERSVLDPKYHIFSTLMRPLFKQFTDTYCLSSKDEFFECLKDFSAKSLTVPSMQTYISDTLSQVRNQTLLPTKL